MPRAAADLSLQSDDPTVITTLNTTVAREHKAKAGQQQQYEDAQRQQLQEMEQDGGRGLSLEIVATRYIAAGEEIFIDDGTEWELAWDEHLKNFRKVFECFQECSQSVHYCSQNVHKVFTSFHKVFTSFHAREDSWKLLNTS